MTLKKQKKNVIKMIISRDVLVCHHLDSKKVHTRPLYNAKLSLKIVVCKRCQNFVQQSCRLIQLGFR